jgi:alpha-tubulin suppressor-like RCC1 family protein
MGLTGVIAVSAGMGHSLALRSDGTVWAWGDNEYGQVGNGVISLEQLTPVQVTGLTHVTQISAGGLFSMAVRSDGTVWAWGYNHFGELGNGTNANSSVPVRVKGLSQVTRIAQGSNRESSLAASTSSTGVTTVWAWGENTDGELGDGTFNSQATPEQVTGINAPGIADLASGESFSLALGADGSVWGWGGDNHGELGNGSAQTVVTRPVLTIGAGSGISRLAVGVNHALAVRSNGTVLAWGDNSSGGLGDGSRASATGPVQVTGLTNALQVSAGWGSSYAVYVPQLVALP